MADGNLRPADPIVEGYAGEGDLLGRIGNWDRLIDARRSGWELEAKQNFDMVAGRQWTSDEEAAMTALSRIPVVFNRIAPTIDAVCGAEISARQQVQYFPRQVGDTAIDDILTQGAEWIMDECDGTQEDSDAFRDALICGEGWTETRPDYQLESCILKERVDPIEMGPDPSSRKPCYADMRYLRRRKPMSKEQFKSMWPGMAFDGDHGLDTKKPVIVDPTIRYDGTNGDFALNRDEVIVREYQWFDEEPRYLVGGPAAQMIKAQWPDVPTQDSYVQLTEEQHAELQGHLPNTQSAKIKVKVFWRCFVAGSTLLPDPDTGQTVQRIEADDFTYKAMTGKRDRNKGWWYGLVRPMIDPQKWANKFYSQILHIMRTNAQGGVMFEEDAVDDIEAFERDWADPSAPITLKKGALSSPNGKKIEVRPTAVYPQGMDRLMEVAVAAIRDTTGVNQEMLGLAERDQPGILESQRKQQAFGILAAFFDGKRRYHRMQGRLLLKMMSLYLPADKLVRVTGTPNPQDPNAPDGPQYVKLALSKDAQEYDVIVDEAPAGPNQKMQVFQVLTQLMPLLQNAGLGAEVWAEIARYSPLPAKVSEMIASSLLQKQQAEQQAAPQQQQIEQAHATAVIAETQSQAAHHQAQANLANAKAAETHVNAVRGAFAPAPSEGPSAEETQAKINLDRAKTSKLLSEVVQSMENPPKETE